MYVSGADTVPAPALQVVLHQVDLSGGAPVDSGSTDRVGAYYLQAPERDTTAIYVASVQYDEITYFSTAVSAVRFTSDTAETLFVYDTSSVAPELTVAQRHVVVRNAESDGSRSVLELVVLRNEGTITRIAANADDPVWQGTIPGPAVNFEVGESDVSPESLYRRGDHVALIAPVPPGEKQLVFAYTLPAGDGTLEVLVDQPNGRLQVLLQDSAAVLTRGPLQAVGTERLEDFAFARFEGFDVPAGPPITFRLTRGPLRAARLWWIVIVASAGALCFAVVVWWRRQPVAVATDNAEVLAAHIAALDESFESRRVTSDLDREHYHAQRAQLKARLAASLAERAREG